MKEGDYDGLYMTHGLDGHDRWYKMKHKFRRGQRDPKASDSLTGRTSGSDGPEKSLGLTNYVKAILIAEHGWTEF